VEHAMRHAVEQEEKIPLSMVTNFNDVVADIKHKLTLLRDNPHCSERPIIYHLDVGRAVFSCTVINCECKISCEIMQTELVYVNTAAILLDSMNL